MEESSPLVETGVAGVRPRAGTRRRLVAGGVLVTATLFGVAAFAARGTLSARLVGDGSRPRPSVPSSQRQTLSVALGHPK